MTASKIASNQAEDGQNDQNHTEDREDEDLDVEMLENENEPT